MRRFTGFVASVAITTAIATFLFFPRGSGAGVLGNFQLRSADPMTGFSENVGFQDVFNIQQNTTILAHVVLSKGNYSPHSFESTNEKRVEGGTLLLRGLTFNNYGLGGDRKWNHLVSAHMKEAEVNSNNNPSILYPPPHPDVPLFRQRITLEPTGHRTIFAVAGPVAFRSLSRDGPRFHFSFPDGAMQGISEADTQKTLDYEVWSTNQVPANPYASEVLLPDYEKGKDFRTMRDTIAQIEKFTRNPAIIGAANVDRPKAEPVLPSNRDIAQHIEQYLQKNYTYTLELGSDKEMVASVHGGQDPMLTFLTKVKKGHCEYFASAMTLMCQSIGIPARLVVGFKCDEYNAIGGFFIVRQSHAHAWCEVFVGDGGGWLTFDPTSGRLADSSARQSWWQSTRHFFDFLEYKWGESVIAYDRTSRQNTINNLDNRMMRAAGDTAAWLHGARRRFQKLEEWISWGRPTAIMSLIVVCAGLVFFTFKTGRAIYTHRLEPPGGAHWHHQLAAPGAASPGQATGVL